MKKIFWQIFFIILFFSFFTNLTLAQESTTTDTATQNCNTEPGKYKLLEGVPFIADACSEISFPEYVSKLYIFAISTIGVAALLMITIGSGYYLVSAGNASTAQLGKTLIKDALLGVLIAFISYLLLYTLNPDILSGRLNMDKMKIDTGKKEVSESENGSDNDGDSVISGVAGCGTGDYQCNSGNKMRPVVNIGGDNKAAWQCFGTDGSVNCP